MRNEKEEAELRDSQGEVVTIADAHTVMRWLKHECPDGRYEIVGHGWALHCQRLDGVVYPIAMAGDMEILKSIVPDQSPPVDRN